MTIYYSSMGSKISFFTYEKRYMEIKGHLSIFIARSQREAIGTGELGYLNFF